MRLSSVARVELTALANRVLEVPAYFDAAGSVLRRLIPYDGVCWFTLDPATALPTSHISRRSIPPEQVPLLAQNEYGEPDVNKFVELAHRQTPAESLRRATDDRPERSTRFSKVLSPNAITDELRAALVLDGVAWGGLALYRRSDRSFSEADVSFLAAASTYLAEGIRRSILAVGANDDVAGPGMMVLALDGEVVSSNVAAKLWMDRIVTVPPPHEASPVPDAVQAVVSRARTGDDVARARMPLKGGGWVSVDASLLGDTGEQVAVMFEPPRSRELAALIVSAYGLSPRERAVAGRVIRGLSTSEIAAELHVSPYTVQDHLKSIFAKVGVRTRAQLANRVFFEQYAGRLADGTNLGPDGWFME